MRVSPTVLLMMVMVFVTQIVGLSIVPMSRGLTSFWPSLAMVLCFASAAALVSRLVYLGVNLSFLMPLIGAGIPLCAILLGHFAFGENASWPKLAVLVTASLLIGLSNLV